MKHSISAQIQAIMEARLLLKKYDNVLKIDTSSIDSRLNDAGSTLAALNLNKENKIGWSNLREALNEKLKK